MQRRTFLTGTALGITLAAFPAVGAQAATTVSSLTALQSAINAAVPGDVITVANGTYAVPDGKPITITGKHGTEAAPITIVAQSRGGVVLTGKQSFVFSGSDNITLSGFAFRQSTTLDVPPDSSYIRLTRNDFQLADISGLHWVMIRGDHSKVDRNHFHNKSQLGIMLGVEGADTDKMAYKVLISKNYFSDHSFTGDNGGEPIRLGVSPRALANAEATVELNLFERTNGDPEAISIKSSGNFIRHNTIRDSKGGIVLRHGNGTQVDSNWILDGQEGIRIYGNDHQIVNNYVSGLSGTALIIGSGTERDHIPNEPPASRTGNDAPDRVTIVHNTLRNNAKTLAGESQRTEEPRDCVVADNLLVGDAGSLVAMATTVRFTWQSNILFGAAADGNIPAGTYTRTDPKLVTGSDGIARLSAASPAIGAATSQQLTVGYDIEGDARGTARDVGCDEYSTAAPVYRPLTTADVGPNAA
ncbi:polysaccharide lyase 6 family protein [Streptomyces beijiangensis]|uniref:Polysaccharide lyase 6 family protein n=1 Tax=Streptomyces beijiangensis TaxID=163361 RepID=A0A939JC70_9ACTN|nr:polysaccharide lyase 6 family protein [Streptomyces beijiangensis]MBO0510691.1 polysaccharide lyase 6 family protein [Streptomyces beijiangensis]